MSELFVCACGHKTLILLFLKICSSFSNFPFASIVFDKHDGPLTSEEEEQRAIAKIKMLGNIKFIGELGKLNLIHESILHKCIKTVSSVEEGKTVFVPKNPLVIPVMCEIK